MILIQGAQIVQQLETQYLLNRLEFARTCRRIEFRAKRSKRS